VLHGKGHSFDHYLDTKHTYAMEIYTHNVWDFCKQNYVHRLIQNQLDGKLIEFGDPIDNQANATPP
jgi:BRCA1-associated protein